jgi:crotonobetainyl-CoA:carnitine CoA-transferase CaiB-like acyl-CoA transferase
MYDVLEGVRVVEVAAWVFVPSAAGILGDWGADVVKVEHPLTGDPQRGLRSRGFGSGYMPVNGFNPMTQIPNHGKRSVGIDLQHPDGVAVLRDLVAQADVFLTSYLDDTRARLGITFDDIRQMNPRIVYGRGSGFGARGPESQRPGYDVAATWARSGIADRLMRGRAHLPPPMMPGSVGDLNGGVSLAGAVAAALYKRERTGEAQQVDVSLYHVGLWMMSQSVTGAPVGLGVEGDAESREDAANPVVNCYRTSDDRWIWLCFLQADRWWPDFCQHIERPDLIQDPRFSTMDTRHENRSECIAILDEVFAQRTLEEWAERFADLEGVWATVQTPLEAAHDVQAKVNGYVTDLRRGDTEFSIVSSPVQFGGQIIGTFASEPEVGQHTEEVLLEMGYDWDRIGDLKKTGSIT